MSAGLGLRRRGRGHARNRRGHAGGRQGYGRRRRYGRPYSRRRNGSSSGHARAGGSGALNLFARLGFVARGIGYIAIGAIAVMVALGIARH